MAPEQRLGDPPTDRSDIYALGVIGRSLLTGNRPDTDSIPALPKETPPALTELLESCTALKPSQRPSATHLAQAFTAFAAQEGAAPLHQSIQRDAIRYSNTDDEATLDPRL